MLYLSKYRNIGKQAYSAANTRANIEISSTVILTLLSTPIDVGSGYCQVNVGNFFSYKFSVNVWTN